MFINKTLRMLCLCFDVEGAGGAGGLPGTPAPGSPIAAPAPPAAPLGGITKEELTAILDANNAKYEERIAGLSGAVTALSTKLKAVSPAATPNKEKPPTTDEEVQRLRDERKTDLEKIARRSRKLGIREAISTHKLSEEDAELLEAYVEQKFGSNIKVDMEPETPVVFLDRGDIEGPQKISDLLSTVMKSKVGEKFKPAKSPPPPAQGGRQGNAGQVDLGGRVTYDKLSPAEREKLTPQERTQRAKDDLDYLRSKGEVI